jgi:hypothetical protein
MITSIRIRDVRLRLDYLDHVPVKIGIRSSTVHKVSLSDAVCVFVLYSDMIGVCIVVDVQSMLGQIRASRMCSYSSGSLSWGNTALKNPWESACSLP